MALIIGLSLPSSPPAAMAGEASLAGFLRFDRRSPSEGSLDTAVRTYRHPESGQVTALVGVIHVGDAAYFREIQSHLDTYDLVLFERVGRDDEERVAELDYGLSRLGRLQYEMAKLLDFSHQMEQIDYTRQNLRHADISLFEFRMALEGGVPGAAMLELLLEWLAPMMEVDLARLKSAKGGDPEFSNRLRWQCAVLMTEADRLLALLGLGGEEPPDDLIIGVRNTIAWGRFLECRPENYQRVAIFYGAAHMPDFERRLLADGWRLEDTRWISAWRIPAPNSAVDAAQPAGPAPPGRIEARL